VRQRTGFEETVRWLCAITKSWNELLSISIKKSEKLEVK
jgi:hypothetical protein